MPSNEAAQGLFQRVSAVGDAQMGANGRLLNKVQVLIVGPRSWVGAWKVHGPNMGNQGRLIGAGLGHIFSCPHHYNACWRSLGSMYPCASSE
jgi:hypothetical protein